jgi:hypothetical protein
MSRVLKTIPGANIVQNDQFFISHKHYYEDGLPNIEEQHEKEKVLDDDQSASSVIHTPPLAPLKNISQTTLFSADVRGASQYSIVYSSDH